LQVGKACAKAGKKVRHPRPSKPRTTTLGRNEGSKYGRQPWLEQTLAPIPRSSVIAPAALHFGNPRREKATAATRHGAGSHPDDPENGIQPLRSDPAHKPVDVVLTRSGAKPGLFHRQPTLIVLMSYIRYELGL